MVYFDNYLTPAQKPVNCHHGVDRQVNAKQKRKELKNERKVRNCKNKS